MKKILKAFVIIALTAAAFISWRGLVIPSATSAQVQDTFRDKTNVLQINPANRDFGWALLVFDLNPYAGQRITLEISMQVWLDAPGSVLWQVNNSNYQIVAGSMNQLSAGQWHSIQGSAQVTPQGGNVLYLSNNQSGNAQRYIADLVIKVNGAVVNADVVVDTALPALHTKWPFYVGAAVTSDVLFPYSPQYGLLRHFNVLVAGNEMKADAIMPNPWTPTGAYRWTNVDQLVSYADANNMKLRGHVLVWHEQTPRAYYSGSGNSGRAAISELYARMENHIKTVFEKTRGRFEWWDVCNEVVGNDGNPRSDSPFTQIMVDAGKRGTDRYEYVLKAFQWARQYADANGGQNVKLFLTEYGIESAGNKLSEFLRLLDYLIANNAPIDGVGIQSHINYESPSVRDFSAAIDEITAKRRGGKNITVQICELDMSIFRSGETNWGNLSASKLVLPDRDLTARLGQQARRYRELFDMFEQKYNEGKLDVVLLWGVTDRETWLNYHPVRGRIDHPMLFDRDSQAKQAYNELIRGR